MIVVVLSLWLLGRWSPAAAAAGALATATPTSSAAAAEDLQAAVTAAIQRGAPSLTIPGGTYRFADGVSLLIHNATDLDIRAPDPVELVFSGSAGVSIVSASRIRIENIAIDYDPSPTKAVPSITYALVNSTDVCTHDLTIRSAPYMAVTAFTGGGNHTFSRLRFAPRPGARWASQRDAIHFSDVRIGPTIEDSSIGWCGDDFVNIKNTLMLLMRCASASSCIVINPHVSGEQPIPFGGTSVLATARQGDHFSFYKWPSSSMIMPQLRTSAAQGSATVASLEAITATPALATEAKSLEQSLIGVWPWTGWTNETMPFGTQELWRVNFTVPLPETIWRRTAPEAVTLINIDDISCVGSKIHRSNFTDTGSQLGRFKSPRGEILGNRFDPGRGAYNLEFSALPQWLEGPVRLEGITVADNVFFDHHKSESWSTRRLPFHCGPLCEATRRDTHQQCMMVSDTAPCPGCPNCSLATPWADVVAENNTVVGAAPLPPLPPPPPAPAGDSDAIQVAPCDSSDARQRWLFDETNGGLIKSLHGDGGCLLATGIAIGPCSAAQRWSMRMQAGATGSWLVAESGGPPCRNLQVYNYSGPNLSEYPCRIPAAEGKRGSQNEEWVYDGSTAQFRSMASEQCCGSRSRPIPHVGLCIARVKTDDGGAHCRTSLSCQLNGLCVDNRCQCDAAFTGANCSVLHRRPARHGAGYSSLHSNFSSWGMSVTYDTNEGDYVGFASEMALGCGLGAWGRNSRCVILRSASPDAPFKRQRVLIDSYCHQATAAQDPTSGRWLWFHLGDCFLSSSPPQSCMNSTPLTLPFAIQWGR
jgi:hypothetical protein